MSDESGRDPRILYAPGKTSVDGNAASGPRLRPEDARMRILVAETTRRLAVLERQVKGLRDDLARLSERVRRLERTG